MFQLNATELERISFSDFLQIFPSSMELMRAQHRRNRSQTAVTMSMMASENHALFQYLIDNIASLQEFLDAVLITDCQYDDSNQSSTENNETIIDTQPVSVCIDVHEMDKGNNRV